MKKNLVLEVLVTGGIVHTIREVGKATLPPNTRVLVYDYDNYGDVDDNGEDCSIDIFSGSEKI